VRVTCRICFCVCQLLVDGCPLLLGCLLCCCPAFGCGPCLLPFCCCVCCALPVGFAVRPCRGSVACGVVIRERSEDAPHFAFACACSFGLRPSDMLRWSSWDLRAKIIGEPRGQNPESQVQSRIHWRERMCPRNKVERERKGRESGRSITLTAYITRKQRVRGTFVNAGRASPARGY